MTINLSVIILTYNEEKHIERCIKSVQSFAQEIFIIDSFSTDKTVELAESLGAKVYQNPWINYAKQFNWGLDNCPIQTKWVMRMDADEYVTSELSNEITQKLDSLECNITGIYLKCRVYFMDTWIRHGGYYPLWILRLWQYKKGRCEDRWMDEHIKVIEGNTVHFENDIVDHNLKGITFWTEKHNGYATREAVDVLNTIYGFIKGDEIKVNFFGLQAQRKRWLKVKYYQTPLFIRPFVYFIYRYFLLAGFLEGKQGLIWHFLQGFWYRFLVDAKIYEIYFKAGKNKQAILELLKTDYGIDLNMPKN
jgi:glycosyltransferase involved in cell wall biosynthesis